MREQDGRVPLPGDARMALPEGSKLSLNSDTTYSIESILGCGGSCIVYKAKKAAAGLEGKVAACLEGKAAASQEIKAAAGSDADASVGYFERSQTIKEFYPKEVTGISCKGSNLTVSAEASASFATRKEEFLLGAKLFEKYYEYDQQFSLPRPIDTIEANGTVYVVSEPLDGNTLSTDYRKLSSLNKIATYMYSVCHATKKFHDDEYLYLDYKPDNMYVRDISGHYFVGLFDFDAVKYLPNIRKGIIGTRRFTPGWAPPEQGNYRRWQKEVGKASDIYSIGAVFLWLLSGKPPNDIETPILKAIEEINLGKFNLDKWSPKLRNKTASVKNLITDILKMTLEQRICTTFDGRSGRLSDVGKLVELFELLGNLTDENPEVIARLEEYRAKGDELHKEMSLSLDGISQKQDETNSLLRKIFNKKSAFIAVAVVLVVALFAGILSHLGGNIVDRAAAASGFEADFDQHLLLTLQIDLENAVHSYEMGLNSWRRLMYNDAESHIKAASDEISKQKSKSEVEVSKINNSLGCLYIDMGRYSEAYEYLNGAYITFKNELGADSLEARATKAGIAQYDFYTGNFEKALTETQEIIDQSNPDKEKIIVASSGHFRAMILDAQGKYEEALATYQGTLELYNEFLNDGKLSETLARYTNDPKVDKQTKDYYTTSLKWIILTYNNIGRVYNRMGKHDEALIALETARAMGEGNIYIGKKNLTSGKIYANLALAKSSVGETKAALDSIETSIAIQRNLFDFEDKFPGLVEAYDLYGSILELKGEPDKALEQYEKAIALSLEAFGENHPQTASASNVLGRYYDSLSDYDTAITYFERAIAIRKAIVGNDHPDTAEFYLNLSITHEKSGDMTAATTNASEAKQICDKLGIVGDFADNVDALLQRLRKA